MLAAPDQTIKLTIHGDFGHEKRDAIDKTTIKMRRKSYFEAS